jgi:predicted transcriptional regulator
MSDQAVQQFMQIMVSNPEVVACYILHDQQLEVFNCVKAGKNTTPLVAKTLGVSSQHASNILVALYKIGYLFRTRRPDPTGGYMYEYRTFEATP